MIRVVYKDHIFEVGVGFVVVQNFWEGLPDLFSAEVNIVLDLLFLFLFIIDCSMLD